MLNKYVLMKMNTYIVTINYHYLALVQRVSVI